MSGTPTLPNRADEVERYLNALDHPFTSAIAGLREAILASNEAITERIKWNAPSFCHAGDDRVTFRLPPKGGFQVIFHRGAKPKASTGFRFEDDSGLLAWAAPDRAVVTFQDAEELRARQADLVAIVNRWMLATT